MRRPVHGPAGKWMSAAQLSSQLSNQLSLGALSSAAHTEYMAATASGTSECLQKQFCWSC